MNKLEKLEEFWFTWTWFHNRETRRDEFSWSFLKIQGELGQLSVAFSSVLLFQMYIISARIVATTLKLSEFKWINLCTSWNHQKTVDFLIISGGIKVY